MGKISKVRLRKKQECWKYEGIHEEELKFLCAPHAVRKITQPKEEKSKNTILPPSCSHK